MITVPTWLLLFPSVLPSSIEVLQALNFSYISSNVILATIFQGIYYHLRVVDEETVHYLAGKLQIQDWK